MPRRKTSQKLSQSKEDVDELRSSQKREESDGEGGTLRSKRVIQDEEDDDLVNSTSSKKSSSTTFNHPTSTSSDIYTLFLNSGIPSVDALKYSNLFQENDITKDMLGDLTYDILRQLDVKVGHQMKIMKLAQGATGTTQVLHSTVMSVNNNNRDTRKSKTMEDDQDPMDLTASVQLPITTTMSTTQQATTKKKGKGKVDPQSVRVIIRNAVSKSKSNIPKTNFGFGSTVTNADKYNIDIVVIRAEIQKSKDFISVENDSASALTSIEAITDEYVGIGNEFGEANILGYDGMLNELARAWVDIFLSRNCKLDKVARGIWENKLLIWDKSPDIEHGTFTDARWACKNGWHDTLLNNVLQGEHIGKFYEPTGLIISRLNMLEREDEPKAALHLAQAADLHQYAAKFLIKLGKVKEAEATALKLKDPAAAFSIATQSRPLDYSIAFKIALHSISVSDSWSTEVMERAVWLTELAISQKITEELVRGASENIRNKTIQFEVCKIMQKLEQFQSAMELAMIVLKPYPSTEINRMKEERQKEKGLDIKVDLVAIQTISEEVENICKVPKTLSKWLWELSYEMNQGTLISQEKLHEILDLILKLVEEVEQLIEIAQDMNKKAEYGLILKVGRRCFELLDNQKRDAHQKKKEFLTRQYRIKELKLEQDELIAKRKQLSKQKQKELQELEAQQQASDVNPYYDASFDNSKLRVCRLVIQAALDSKISPLLEKVMSKSAIDDVISTTLFSLEDVNHMIQLAEDMRARAEYEYILKYGERALQSSKKLFIEHKEREKRKEELRKLRLEQSELQQVRQQLDDSKQTRLKELEIEELLLPLLPHYVASANFDNNNLVAAKLLTSAALDIKAKKILDIIQNPALGTETQLDEEVWKVVENCLKYVKSPAHMMQLGSLLKDREAYQMVLRVGRVCMERLQKMKKRFNDRQQPLQKLQVLRELENLYTNMNKPVPSDVTDEIKKADEAVSKLPKLPMYDPNSYDQYDNLTLQAAQQMLSTVYDSKSKLEAKIAKDLEMTTKQIKTERENKDKEFSDVASYCIGKDTVQNPQHMFTLATTASNWKDYMLVMQLVHACLERVEQVRVEQEKRVPFTNELDKLREERDKLAVFRKLLPEEQQERLNEMELEDKIYRTGPSYKLNSLKQLDNLISDNAQLIMRTNLDAKDLMEQRFDNDTENLITQEERESERKKIQSHIKIGLQYCLTYVVDPNNLFKLAKAVSDRPRKEVELVFKLGEQTQSKIRDINELRKIREPLQSRINELRNEIAVLDSSKKPIPPETHNELEKHEKALSKLPKYPHFSDLFNYHEYDALNLKIVQVLILVVLDRRTALDGEIKLHMDHTGKVEQLVQERSLVSQQIEDIVSLALTNVHDPNLLHQFQSDIKTRKEAELVVRVGERAIARIRQLEEQREVRAPLQKQIDGLKKEQEQLALNKKKLSPEQEKQLIKLVDKVKSLPEWPHYSSLFNYNEYNNLILQVVKNMVLVLLDNKRSLQDKIRIAKENEDPNFDHAQALEEKAALESKLKTVVAFAIQNVQNPENLSVIQSDLQSYQEVDFVQETGDRVQILISRLEDMRKERAPLQEQIDKLKKEEQQLQEKKKQLSAQQQTTLTQLEKKIHSLPRWPYFAALFNYHQYNDLNWKSTQINLQTLRDAKTNFEQRVAKLIEDDAYAMNEDDLNKEKAELQAKLQKMMVSGLSNLRNPQHLYNFASDLRYNGEPEIALYVAEKLYETIKRIDDMREVRAPLQKQLDKLRLEEEELLKQKKTLTSQQVKILSDLEEKLKKLPDWPYFATLFSYNQYDRLCLQAGQLTALSYIEKLSNLEESFKKQLFEDPASANHEQFHHDRKSIQECLNKSVSLCMHFVHDPNLLYQFARDLSNRSQASLVIRVADKANERILVVEKIRQEKDRLQEHINLLQEEQAYLEAQKKQLALDQQKQLEALLDELSKMRIPDYVSRSYQHDMLQLEVATCALECAFNRKLWVEQQLVANEEVKQLTDIQAQELKQTSVDEIAQAIRIAKFSVHNPFNVQNLGEKLRDRNEYDYVIEVEKRSLDILEKLEEDRKSREQSFKDLLKLREEKDLLEQQRKQLPSQQMAQLRSLELEQRLLHLMPSYVSAGASSYDDGNFSASLVMITALLDQKVDYENKIAMDDAKQQEEIDNDRKQLKQALDNVVDDCLPRLQGIENLIKLAEELSTRREFLLVIRTGERCEQRLDQLRQELEMREQIHLQLSELEQKVLLQKEGPTDEQKALLDKLTSDLEKLPVEYADRPQLDAWTLQVAGLVINAAKIEDNDEVLRVQTTLAFKVETTPDRWNQVKMLTSEQEWEDVKKELVIYLMKAPTDPEDKNYIDPRVKIDLLLKEGLWSHCIDIFPKPTGNEEELENLWKMWMEVEKNSPENLPQLHKTVERYVKRYFQEFKFNSLDKIIDQVQRRYPDLILHFFKDGVEMLLINILPSQYAPFVQLLRSYLKRFQNLGKSDDWNKWLESFKTKHKGKKKLMNMVAMLSDSSFNIQSVKAEPKK